MAARRRSCLGHKQPPTVARGAAVAGEATNCWPASSCRRSSGVGRITPAIKAAGRGASYGPTEIASFGSARRWAGRRSVASELRQDRKLRRESPVAALSGLLDHAVTQKRRHLRHGLAERLIDERLILRRCSRRPRRPQPLPRVRGGSSQQPRARVIAEEMGIAHIAAQRVHTPMAALVHHFEDRGAAPRGRCEEAGPEGMAGEELRVKPDAPGARLDDPDHGGIGQARTSTQRPTGDDAALTGCRCGA